MKNKCIKCQQIRKASGVSYLKCCKCKKLVMKERKISKRLNQDSINKFIKERNGIKS